MNLLDPSIRTVNLWEVECKQEVEENQVKSRKKRKTAVQVGEKNQPVGAAENVKTHPCIDESKN